uniref:Leucine rich repeat protein n=1 Tax=Tetraselmis sp. GSL018 TaxID=582737 RepID=A0A061SBZ1_9CHLO
MSPASSGPGYSLERKQAYTRVYPHVQSQETNERSGFLRRIDVHSTNPHVDLSLSPVSERRTTSPASNIRDTPSPSAGKPIRNTASPSRKQRSVAKPSGIPLEFQVPQVAERSLSHHAWRRAQTPEYTKAKQRALRQLPQPREGTAFSQPQDGSQGQAPAPPGEGPACTASPLSPKAPPSPPGGRDPLNAAASPPATPISNHGASRQSSTADGSIPNLKDRRKRGTFNGTPVTFAKPQFLGLPGSSRRKSWHSSDEEPMQEVPSYRRAGPANGRPGLSRMAVERPLPASPEDQPARAHSEFVWSQAPSLTEPGDASSKSWSHGVLARQGKPLRAPTPLLEPIPDSGSAFFREAENDGEPLEAASSTPPPPSEEVSEPSRKIWGMLRGATGLPTPPLQQRHGRQLQTFQAAQDSALADHKKIVQEAADQAENAKQRPLMDMDNRWGSVAGDLREKIEVAAEVPEEAKEDLMYRLSAAQDSGFLNMTYNLWPDQPPPEVSDFLRTKGRHLKALNLEGNQTRNLPDVFSQMRVAVSINLASNCLAHLPDSLCRLPCLTSLSLEKNDIATVPEAVGELHALTYLDLSHNRISWLPDSIRSLKKLITLKVAHNRMCHLPEQICSMSALKEINAAHNVITGIPSEVANLAWLEVLLLDHNRLTALPAAMGGLWRSLLELDLRHNTIAYLPSTLGACKKIEVLELASNPLIVPPPMVVRQGTSEIIKYLNGLNSELRGMSSKALIKERGQNTRSKRSIASIVSRVQSELGADEDTVSNQNHTAGSECSSCVSLYAEIDKWKAEVSSLADELDQRREEVEQLKRDGGEIRANMMRKQNRLREAEEALNTARADLRDANKRISLLEEQLQLAEEYRRAAEAAEDLKAQIQGLSDERAELCARCESAESDAAEARRELSLARASAEEAEGSAREAQQQAREAQKAEADMREAKAAAEHEAFHREEMYLERIARLEKALAEATKQTVETVRTGEMSFPGDRSGAGKQRGAKGQQRPGRTLRT